MRQYLTKKVFILEYLYTKRKDFKQNNFFKGFEL